MHGDIIEIQLKKEVLDTRVWVPRLVYQSLERPKYVTIDDEENKNEVMIILKTG